LAGASVDAPLVRVLDDLARDVRIEVQQDEALAC
jgi:hypothetical protein